MPAAYSADIRGQVIARVGSGSSRREAAGQSEFSDQMGCRLSSDWKLCSQTAGWEHLTAGGARGLFAGAD